MAYFVKTLKPVLALGAAVLISGCATQQAAAPYQTAPQPYAVSPYAGQNGVAAEQYYDPAYPVDPYYQDTYAAQAPGYYYDPYPVLGIGAVSVLAIGSSYYGNRYDDDYYYSGRRGHGHAVYGGKKSGPKRASAKKARRIAKQTARAEAREVARVDARNSAKVAARKAARVDARNNAKIAARKAARMDARTAAKEAAREAAKEAAREAAKQAAKIEARERPRVIASNANRGGKRGQRR